MHIKLLLFLWPFYCYKKENTRQKATYKKEKKTKGLGFKEKDDNSCCNFNYEVDFFLKTGLNSKVCSE